MHLRCGFISGRALQIYRERYWHDAQFAAVHELQGFFNRRNKPLTQVAIAWMLAQPAITSAIVGATSAAQLKQSLPATELQLDEEEMDFCNDIWMRLPRMTDPGLMR